MSGEDRSDDVRSGSDAESLDRPGPRTAIWPLPCVESPRWDGVTMIFSGLMAYVPHGSEKLTVLLPDARHGSEHMPAHRAAFAHVRIDNRGVLHCNPIAKVLEDESLELQVGDGAHTGSSINLDRTHLAEMQRASATDDPDHGHVNRACVDQLHNCIAALHIEARRLGEDVHTEYPKGSRTGHFDDGEPHYAVELTDELRLVMRVPRAPMTLFGERRKTGRTWRVTIAEPTDRAACLMLMNLVLDDPESLPREVDHHFDRYYDLLRGVPPRRRLPHFVELGGYVPKCAKAVMEP